MDIEEIRGSVVNSLIMSSLCSASDKANYSRQLFRLYQQYNEDLLSRVTEHLKDSKMVKV